VQVPAIRKRVVSLLVNVNPLLAQSVANSLGIELPPAMPLASNLPIPKFAPSPALSLLSRPGETGIKTRRVAILVGSGVESLSVNAIYHDLLSEGAVPRIVSSQLGKVAAIEGNNVDIEISFETGPSVLYDAVVIADGAESVQQLMRDANAVDFIRQQYRHCKPILAIGGAEKLLAKAEVNTKLSDGSTDTGVFIADKKTLNKTLIDFKALLANHRSFVRETDPPTL
jgi:catalase